MDFHKTSIALVFRDDSKTSQSRSSLSNDSPTTTSQCELSALCFLHEDVKTADRSSAHCSRRRGQTKIRGYGRVRCD